MIKKRFSSLDNLGPRYGHFSDFDLYNGAKYLANFPKNGKILETRPTHTSFDAELHGLSESAFLFCLRPRILEIFGFKGRKSFKIGLLWHWNCSRLGSKSKNRRLGPPRHTLELSKSLTHLSLAFHRVQNHEPLLEPVENRKNAEKCVGENASPISSEF